MGRMSLRILGILALALLGGCSWLPGYKPPAAPAETGYTPAGVPRMASVDGAGAAQHFALGRKISAEWWKVFRSPALDAILTEAVTGNRTLAAAKANLAQAHEAVAVAAAGYYPNLDFGSGAQRERNNYKAVGLTTFPPKEFNLYSLGPTVSYSFNVAGLTAKRVEQAKALEAVQNYETQAAYLTLTGDVVTEVVTIASIRAQIQAVEDILKGDSDNLRLVQDELRAGAATDLDIQTATSQLATDRTLLPPLRQQLSVARDALAVLLGRAPATWSPPDFDLDQLTLPTALPVSLPSALVHQRPDILASEAQLEAASASVGIATAQLYPNITLSADVMEQFLKPDAIFDPASNIWSFGANLAAPLFHGGALRAQKRGSEDAFDAARANYEQTVLQSFRQIADLLQGLSHDAEMLAAEHNAYQSASKALQLVRISYRLGNSTLLQVLDAQRIFDQARIGLARAQAQRYLDSAQLFVAMGGGWWERAPEAPRGGAPAKPSQM
jgi:NodT family efflux transporter outer membrane factor (OMF) lipoprotein